MIPEVGTSIELQEVQLCVLTELHHCGLRVCSSTFDYFLFHEQNFTFTWLGYIQHAGTFQEYGMCRILNEERHTHGDIVTEVYILRCGHPRAPLESRVLLYPLFFI